MALPQAELRKVLVGLNAAVIKKARPSYMDMHSTTGLGDIDNITYQKICLAGGDKAVITDYNWWQNVITSPENFHPHDLAQMAKTALLCYTRSAVSTAVIDSEALDKRPIDAKP